MAQTLNTSSKAVCLEHSNLGHSVLSFDIAQGGEPVEPFRISIFVLRI